jgi:aryl-alcohol dehydrogenase-like predicted oxidoreductase
MIRSVEASLKRLKTDCIDLLYLHIWDFTTPIEEILRGMEDLVSAGKILYPGISDTPAWIVSQGQTLARLRGWPGFVAYQGEYNLLERGIEQDVIPMTRALGMSLLTFGLLGGGALTGKFNQPGKPAQATRIKETSELEKVAASIVMQIASETGHTPSQISINWVRQQAENIIPILGARRLSQIVDNLGAIEFTLDGEHIQRLSDIHPQHPIYPHTFWNDFVRRDLIFGDHLDSLD